VSGVKLKKTIKGRSKEEVRNSREKVIEIRE
jgi:hypothetical protein